MQISGATTFVAGGSSGLGKATALHLAGLGANVLVGDLQPFEGDQRIAFCETDVTDEESVTAALDVARSYFWEPVA